MKCRQLVQDTFERIVIYHSTTTLDDTDGRHMELLLMTKGDRPRFLRVNKKTGAWEAGEEGGDVTL